VMRQYDLTMQRADYQLLATEYGKAFAQGGLDVDADAAGTAAQIRNLVLADNAVSALDEWALAAFMLEHGAEHRKLLDLAKLADRDPIWRDRFRDPDAWDDKRQLRQLANDAAAMQDPPPAHQLAITSTLLRRLGTKAEAIRMLRAAQRRRPDDFWLNWETARAYQADFRYREALPFYRVVVSLRPHNVWTIYGMSQVLMYLEEYDESIAELRQAIAIDPENETLRLALATVLIRNGQYHEVLCEWERCAEALPNKALAPYFVGTWLAYARRHEEAL